MAPPAALNFRPSAGTERRSENGEGIGERTPLDQGATHRWPSAGIRRQVMHKGMASDLTPLPCQGLCSFFPPRCSTLLALGGEGTFGPRRMVSEHDLTSSSPKHCARLTSWNGERTPLDPTLPPGVIHFCPSAGIRRRGVDKGMVSEYHLTPQKLHCWRPRALHTSAPRRELE